MAVMTAILWAYFWDAVRDAWWLKNDKTWLQYHLPKWLSFHALPLVMMVYFLDWYLWPVVAVCSWIVWQIGMRWPGGREWKSMWVKLLEKWMQ